MTPNQIAKAGTEHAIQAALMCWCSQHPDKDSRLLLRWLHAIPNGGARGRAQASRLKAEGVKSGVADLMLPVARRGYHGFYIEMKTPKAFQKGELWGMSDTQAEFRDFVIEANYLHQIHASWWSAASALDWYLESIVNGDYA